MKVKKKKLKSISWLKKEADRVFSLWIRERDKRCVLCGSTKNLQNGHYISRGINILRYSEVNCNTCCVGCNVFKHGNMAEYALFMQRTHGDGILKQLGAIKQQLHQFKREELQEIITKYSPTE